jgi:hypothetical protein
VDTKTARVMLKDSKGDQENFEKNFEELCSDQVVENLALSDNQVLLLRVLGMSLIFTAPRNFFRQPCTNQSQDAHVGTKRKSNERSVDGVQPLPLREFKRMSNPLYLVECR